VRAAPLLTIALAALVLAGCGGSKAAPRISAPAPAPSPYRGSEVPAATAPPIALHDASGRPVTLASQRGRWTLVTFLYTHCPDVCPLIAANLDQALRQVDAARSRVGVLAVSVDPRGDTPAAVLAYTRRHHLVPQFRYLIGTRAQLHRVWVSYHVAAVSGGADLVDHVSYTMLIDPRGKERLLYDAQVKAGAVVHDLRLLMGAKTTTA
jgi:protein SCO1/2